MNTSSKFLATAIAGAAVGAAAALLLAPATGADTRKKLMGKVKSAKDSLDGYLAKGESALNDVASKGKSVVKEA